MSHDLENYIRRIVDQTDGSRIEKEELYEEMLLHVYLIREEELERGKSMKEANQIAMKTFGNEAQIGDQLQQAMFPFRKELLLFLAILGFIFTFSHYVYVLVEEKTALFHVLAGVLGHSAILFFALNRFYPIHRKIWLSLALLLNLLLLVFNMSFAPFGFAMYSVGYNIYWIVGFLFMVLLNLYLLYRTVLSYHPNSENKTYKRVIHAVNMTLGLAVSLPGIAMFLFTIAFGAPVLILLNFFIPLIIWGILYTVQIYFARRYPKAATGSLVLSILVLGMIFAPWITLYIFN